MWLAGFGVLGVASVMATTLWTRVSPELSWLVVGVTLLANGVLWLFTSWWLPNRKVTFRSMLPAAAAGAVMLEALKVIGGIWVPRLVSNASELWGTIGTVGAYEAMRHGTVDEAWAKDHHRLWYDDVKAGRIPAQRSASGGTDPTAPTASVKV